MVDFAGYKMPIQYTGITAEHLNVRDNVGIFDVSHMGEFIVHGPESEQFLNYICSNKIENIKIGKAQYNLLINKNGGIIDDLIVYKTSSFEYMLVVNAANIEKDYDWIKKNISGFNCEINDRSDDLGLISVQGPNSTKLLDEIFMDVNINEITRFGFKKIEDKDLFFVIKEHPSDSTKFKHLHKVNERILFRNFDSKDLIEKSLATLTLNSTVGLESLILGKKLILLGESCFKIEGITRSPESREQLVECINSIDSWELDLGQIGKYLDYLNEKDMVQDLVVAASNKALKEIDIKIKEYMKEKTGDIIPNIPGFDMGNLFK